MFSITVSKGDKMIMQDILVFGLEKYILSEISIIYLRVSQLQILSTEIISFMPDTAQLHIWESSG
jgi:hypothetical protein